MAPFAPFDLLDDRLLSQILLRCRAADLRPLTKTCHRFRESIECHAFRQERIRTEWAEVATVVWTSKRRYCEDIGTHRSDYTDSAFDNNFADDDVSEESSCDDSNFDFSECGCLYDENGRIAQPGTSQNTIDLMVDETIVGRAEYALVKRRYAASFALDQWDDSIGGLFFNYAGRPKISIVKKAMKHGAGQRQAILFISMVRWEEEYRNNSYIGAKAFRSFLVDDSRLAGQWSACFYIADSAMQLTATDEITCHQVQDPKQPRMHLLTQEDHQTNDEWYSRQDQLRTQDMRQFFRAGFQQVEEILQKSECRVVFAVPFQLQGPLSTAIAADSVVAYEFPPLIQQCKSSADQELNTIITTACVGKDTFERDTPHQLYTLETVSTPYVQYQIDDLTRKPDVVKDSIEWAKRKVMESKQELVALERRLEAGINIPANEGLSRAARTRLANYEAAYGQTLESPEGSRPYYGAVYNIVVSQEQEMYQSWIDHLLHDASGKIKILVEEHGATILGSNVVHTCVSYGDIDILMLILEFLPKCRIKEVINSRDPRGWTPLMRAARSGRTNAIEEKQILLMIEKLLHLGADKDMVDSSGFTATDHFGYKTDDDSLTTRIQRLLEPSGGPAFSDRPSHESDNDMSSSDSDNDNDEDD
jgi:Ankyrin repeats (3 copies)